MYKLDEMDSYNVFSEAAFQSYTCIQRSKPELHRTSDHSSPLILNRPLRFPASPKLYFPYLVFKLISLSPKTKWDTTGKATLQLGCTLLTAISPTCKKACSSRCVKKQHVLLCSIDDEYYMPGKECASCRAAEERRLKEEREKAGN